MLPLGQQRSTDKQYDRRHKSHKTCVHTMGSLIGGSVDHHIQQQARDNGDNRRLTARLRMLHAEGRNIWRDVATRNLFDEEVKGLVNTLPDASERCCACGSYEVAGGTAMVGLCGFSPEAHACCCAWRAAMGLPLAPGLSNLGIYAGQPLGGFLQFVQSDPAQPSRLTLL